MLSRRLHNAYGNKVSVVNEAIGGNRVIPPVVANATAGPAAVDRLDRDVLGLSGLTHVIWLEGINDLGAGYGQAASATPVFENPVIHTPANIIAASVWGFAAFSTFVPLYALELGLNGSRYVFALFSVVVISIRTFGAKLPDALGGISTGEL